MRMILMLATVTLATAGCASVNRAGGANGAAVVSGETVKQSSESGAAYDNIATSGGNPSDPVTGPAR